MSLSMPEDLKAFLDSNKDELKKLHSEWNKKSSEFKEGMGAGVYYVKYDKHPVFER
jgi:hypothetical protein